MFRKIKNLFGKKKKTTQKSETKQPRSKVMENVQAKPTVSNSRVTSNNRRDYDLNDPLNPLNPSGLTSPISPLNPASTWSSSDNCASSHSHHASSNHDSYSSSYDSGSSSSSSCDYGSSSSSWD
jgi:hypothetical protein